MGSFLWFCGWGMCVVCEKRGERGRGRGERGREIEEGEVVVTRLVDAVVVVNANVRCRLLGFFLGSTMTGGGIYYYVLDEYKVSNELLMEDIYVCDPLLISLCLMGSARNYIYSGRGVDGCFWIGSSGCGAAGAFVCGDAGGEAGCGGEGEEVEDVVVLGEGYGLYGGWDI